MKIEELREELENNTGRREGPIARAIEVRTAQISSEVFLLGAMGTVVLTAVLRMQGKRDSARFVSQWAPTILMLGFYNKLVKVAGSDTVTAEPGRPID